MSGIRLNIEAIILQSLVELIEQQNAASQAELDAPRVHIAATSEDLVHAAQVMAQAFVRNRDKAWIAWLRPADVKRIRAGDFVDAERKIARVIHYLLQAALRTGGVVVLETAREEPQGARTVRGAALRTLPSAIPSRPGLFHELTVGAPAALRAYGLRRTLAAQSASAALQRATHAMRVREGVPERCIYGGMVCVHPVHEQKRVASRMSRPFQRLADIHGLSYLLQSSNPDRNDTRVFKGFGFRHTGEFVYGASKLNSVGPYTVKLMIRSPAPVLPE
ncbi:hypothetical protein SAMN05518854_114118 [Variovorax sp. YR266]|uniref:hypothetical protein n=1 Tax=Variovorax sp. YR266 TaxID=1884386 RepID=UPI00089516FD|nr:hypothetical protein [Variovorax sp. YR266]SDZ70531.1 hypothetical protein SAMN05518854_114118 [Variovorax sp. YR266]